MILVSACLAGVPCRMDGRSKPVEAVRRLVESGQAVLVCPETLGGLPTPREPGEIRGGRVVTESGRDITDAYRLGAEKALEIYREKGCTAAVLKARSPSCGKGLIHDGTFSGGMTSGNGVCAQLFIDMGIPVYTEDELDKLLP